MHPGLASVKAVGFDLDRTLYTERPEMTARIEDEMYYAILKFKPELETITRAKEAYEKRYSALRSWPKVLEEAGLRNPQETVIDCLALAGIADLIARDEELVRVIKLLHKKFFLFLITGSPRNLGIKKLLRIGINPDLFSFTLFGDDRHFFSKHGPESFLYFLSQSPHLPAEHVYIGDNVKTDILVPKSLGIRTMAIGRPCPEADFWVEHIHDIEELLLP